MFSGRTFDIAFNARLAQRILKVTGCDSTAITLPVGPTILASGNVRSPILAPTSIATDPSVRKFRMTSTSDSLYCPYRSKHVPMYGPAYSIQPYLHCFSVSEPNCIESSLRLLEI